MLFDWFILHASSLSLVTDSWKKERKRNKVTFLLKYLYKICTWTWFVPLFYQTCVYLPTLLSLRSLVRWWCTFPVAALSNSGINSLTKKDRKEFKLKTSTAACIKSFIKIWLSDLQAYFYLKMHTSTLSMLHHTL